MRRSGRIGQRGADAGQSGYEAYQLQVADELVDLLLTALEVHAEHTAVAVALELLVGQRLAGGGLQTGVVDLFHLGMALEEFGQCQTVFSHLLYPQGQRPQAPGQQPGFRGAQIRAVETQVEAQRLDDLLGADHRATYQIIVTAQILGGAVNHQIRAVLDGLGNDRSGKGVVDKQLGAVGVSHVRQMLDVRYAHQGVGNGLAVYQLGVGTDIVRHILRVEVDEGGLHAPALQLILQVVERLAVDDGGGHDVIAGFHRCQNGGRNGRHAGGEYQTLFGPVTGGQDLRGGVGVGIAQTEVSIAGSALVADLVDGINGVEDVGRGQVDGEGLRHSQSLVQLIAQLAVAGMDIFGRVAFFNGHRNSSLRALRVPFQYGIKLRSSLLRSPCGPCPSRQ